MARGSEVALFASEPRDIPLSLRVTKSDSERLDGALENEKKDPRNKSLSRTELAARLFSVGLHVYTAMEAAGSPRAREIAALTGQDQLDAMAEVVRRGLAAIEAERAGPKRSR